ncbi:hypothetical protein LTR53_004427 [Teratosphaeriaceae sp. CCFEE 6253]|nr:hypothetical protein LTR53_004427 [Teratosphaeriaceae sp. CCFEE 6253]
MNCSLSESKGAQSGDAIAADIAGNDVAVVAGVANGTDADPPRGSARSCAKAAGVKRMGEVTDTPWEYATWICDLSLGATACTCRSPCPRGIVGMLESVETIHHTSDVVVDIRRKRATQPALQKATAAAWCNGRSEATVNPTSRLNAKYLLQSIPSDAETMRTMRRVSGCEGEARSDRLWGIAARRLEF